MTNIIETTDINALLDSLTDGEHAKATWEHNKHTIAVEGPVYVDGMYCECHKALRWTNGDVEETLTSFEVTHTEDVTATRDDEKALNALLDSLEDGQEVTAEWRDEDGSMTITGTVETAGTYQEVYGYHTDTLRWHDGTLCDSLHSVTVRRTAVQRWERDGDE